jgi:hypothetical protein
MKFFRYKQVVKLNFFGSDDLNGDNAASYYTTPVKGGYYNNEINTKRYKFNLDSLLQNVQLSNNAKLTLESVYLPDIYTWDPVAATFGADRANFSNTIVKTNNISGNNWDSSNGSRGPNVLFTSNNTFTTFINPSPEILYNYSIPSNFLKNGGIEFEVVYNMDVGVDLDNAHHRKSLEFFNLSLVIYDINEEELILTNTPEVDYKRFGPMINLNNGRN